MRQFSPREINWLKKWEVYETSQIKKYGEMPVEYITGWAEFYGREFEVNQNVLIPRIETEQLVDEAVKILTSKIDSHAPPKTGLGMTKTIADIGTGCGCIGITLYLELVKLGIKPTIYISDISERVLDVAAKNMLSLRAEGRQTSRSAAIPSGELDCHVANAPRNDSDNFQIRLIKSNLFNSYPKDLKFDLIVANLPYIPSARIPKLPKSVKDFEPLLALDGGPNGLKLINKLIAQSKSRLKLSGVLLLEIDENHRIKDLLLPKKFRVKIIRDQFGKKRFVKISWKK